MNSMTHFLEALVLDAVLLGKIFNPPDRIWIGLFLAEPSKDGTGQEAEGAGYARAEAVFRSGAEKGLYFNSMPVNFPEAQEDLGVVTHFAAFDRQENGHMLFFAKLDEPLDVLFLDAPRVPAGLLRVRFATKPEQLKED